MKSSFAGRKILADIWKLPSFEIDDESNLSDELTSEH